MSIWLALLRKPFTLRALGYWLENAYLDLLPDMRDDVRVGIINIYIYIYSNKKLKTYFYL